MKRNLINVGISILTLVVCFAVAEGAVRAFSIDRCQIADFGTARSRDFYRFAEKSTGLLYEHIPGIEGTLHGAKVRINSHGMKGPEVREEKPADIFRIAILGDSVAFGYGVEEEDSFPRILEKKLNERLKTPSEMLNFAVTGYASIQEFIVLTDKVPSFAPDLVIIAHHLNDIYNPGKVAIAPPPLKAFVAENSRLTGCFRLWHKLETRFMEKNKQEIEEFKATYTEAYTPNSPIWLRHKDLIEWFGKSSQKIILVLLPIWENFNENYPYAEAHKSLKDTGLSAGLKIIDLSPLAVKYEQPDSFYRLIPNDPDHPNPVGHEKLAELIYDGLAKQELLPN